MSKLPRTASPVEEAFAALSETKRALTDATSARNEAELMLNDARFQHTKAADAWHEIVSQVDAALI